MNRLSYAAALAALAMATGPTTSAATAGAPDAGPDVDLVGPIPTTATSRRSP
jgi:hypothetical protein